MAIRAGSYISLASGGGGLDVGVERGSGGTAQPVVYVERELTAAALLVTRMEDESLPPAPVWSDLRTFDAGAWRGIVDGVVGGFPCQPYSVAGKQAGADDPRDLWPECVRVLVESGARWAFFENVGGARKEYERRFGPDLMAAGFRSRGVVVRASDVGAPHQRARLFFAAVADAEHTGRKGGGKRSDTSREASATARSGAPVADTEHEGLEGGARGGHDGAGRARGESATRCGPVADAERGAVRDESGRLSGQNGAGATEPRHAGAAVGHADGSRRRAQGDAGQSPEQPHQAVASMEWPPGPTSPDWQRVPRDFWPALPKPEIRGLDDGLDLSRADWIRILGNGVVPQQAALAWRILWGLT